MWQFSQSTGLMRSGRARVGYGWAGQREGRNNPAMQDVPGVGPLPQGHYLIGEPHNSPHTGPYTLDLSPALTNTMFGRSGFRIHGAAADHPELSSEGCIILPRFFREIIWESGVRDLEVVP